MATIWRCAIGERSHRPLGVDADAELVEHGTRHTSHLAIIDEVRLRAEVTVWKAMFSATDISGNRARSCQITWMPSSCARAGVRCPSVLPSNSMTAPASGV